MKNIRVTKFEVPALTHTHTTLVSDSTDATGTKVIGTDGGEDPLDWMVHRLSVFYDSGTPVVTLEGRDADGADWQALDTVDKDSPKELLRPWPELRVTWASGGGGVNLTIELAQMRAATPGGGGIL